ncbi:MAG: endonuclease domain-containing protein [Wenzhouxiangella sp.]|nr:MAG: endonuclease domain-containing protein [Wenzhouxiangella sp.]
MSCPAPAPGWRPAVSSEFVFAGWSFSEADGEARLNYRLDGHPLTETFRFPLSVTAPVARRQALDAALDLLHWVAGISYWKAGCPAGVEFAGKRPDQRQAAWLNTLYREGLGEFAWNNGLEVERFKVFAGGPEASPPADEQALDRAFLVAMGGGKDSLVAWSRLDRRGLETVTAQVGQAALIERVAQRIGHEHLIIERRLDPALAAFNRAGAWNGHVPVTAINAAALVVLALLRGFGQVVFANERSAEEATLTDARGRSINHQFAKTLAFEGMLDDWVRTWIAADLRVFSLLRRDRELAICKEFAALGRFHDVFSSCNRNFHLDGARTSRWCGHCPKCHFVFLGLAPFMTPDELIAIFGANLLADSRQLDGFKSLLALDGCKPFECVGEAAEARAAIRALAARPEWCEQVVVRALNAALGELEVPTLDTLCRPGGPHLIPAELLDETG